MPHDKPVQQDKPPLVPQVLPDVMQHAIPQPSRPVVALHTVGLQHVPGPLDEQTLGAVHSQFTIWPQLFVAVVLHLVPQGSVGVHPPLELPLLDPLELLPLLDPLELLPLLDPLELLPLLDPLELLPLLDPLELLPLLDPLELLALDPLELPLLDALPELDPPLLLDEPVVASSTVESISVVVVSSPEDASSEVASSPGVASSPPPLDELDEAPSSPVAPSGVMVPSGPVDPCASRPGGCVTSTAPASTMVPSSIPRIVPHPAAPVATPAIVKTNAKRSYSRRTNRTIFNLIITDDAKLRQTSRSAHETTVGHLDQADLAVILRPKAEGPHNHRGF